VQHFILYFGFHTDFYFDSCKNVTKTGSKKLQSHDGSRLEEVKNGRHHISPGMQMLKDYKNSNSPFHSPAESKFVRIIASLL